ncbi:hypothetical protein Tco_1278461, partial [Tanacetum coccineum]
PLLPTPNPETADPKVIDAYYELLNAQQEVACLMPASMTPDLQKTLEDFTAFDMLQELKTMFKEQAKHELFKTLKAFHALKQDEGQSVSSYLLKMKGYLHNLECLGYPMPQDLELIELHVILKLAKKGIPKKVDTLAFLAIRGGKIQKDKNKMRGAKGKEPIRTLLSFHGMRVNHVFGSLDVRFSENVSDVNFKRDLFNGDVSFLDIVPKEMVMDFDVFRPRVLHRVFAKVNRAFLAAHDRNVVDSNVVVDKSLFHP